MKYFEDYEVGQHFAFGAYRMEEAEMLAYAGQFDPQPFHLDEAAARETIYGGLIASGWFTLTVMLRLLTVEFHDMAMQGSPGWDEIRWLAPVRAGDVLSVEGELIETRASRSRPEIGFFRGRFAVSNQAGETVQTAVPTWIVRRREPAG